MIRNPNAHILRQLQKAKTRSWPVNPDQPSSARPDPAIVQQLVGQLSWGHNVVLLAGKSALSEILQITSGESSRLAASVMTPGHQPDHPYWQRPCHYPGPLTCGCYRSRTRRLGLSMKSKPRVAVGRSPSRIVRSTVSTTSVRHYPAQKRQCHSSLRTGSACSIK